MSNIPEEYADQALDRGMYFQLEWPSGSPLIADRPRGNYVPSDALGNLGAEIDALRALAKKNCFELPFAAPFHNGVKLPTIPKEWISGQLPMLPDVDEKARFDAMIHNLSDASEALQRTQVRDDSELQLRAIDKNLSDDQDEGHRKASKAINVSTLETKVLISLAKSTLSLGVPCMNDGLNKINAPPLLTLTQPAHSKTPKLITIYGVITSVSLSGRTIIIDDKFFVRNYNGPDPVVGHQVQLTVYTTLVNMKLDVVDWTPEKDMENDDNL